MKLSTALSAGFERSKLAVCAVLWLVNIALWGWFVDLAITRFVLGALLVVANVMVWYGVYLENDDFPKEKKDKGWRILIRGLAVESTIGFFLLAVDTSLGITQKAESARANERAANANNRAANAERLAGELGVKVDDLPNFVAQKKKEIDNEIDGFSRSTAAQKTQIDSFIASLSAKKREVEATIAAAQKDEGILRTSADTIRDLRQTIHDLTSDRKLTDEQAKELTNSVKAIKDRVFDVSAFQTVEAWSLARQIGDSLHAGGWDWQPRNMFPQLDSPGVIKIGNDPGTGIRMEVCNGDVTEWEATAGVILSELGKDGLKATGSNFPDEEAKMRAEPCGRIHILVGSKY
jgi:hypothetical protein